MTDTEQILAFFLIMSLILALVFLWLSITLWQDNIRLQRILKRRALMDRDRLAAYDAMLEAACRSRRAEWNNR